MDRTIKSVHLSNEELQFLINTFTEIKEACGRLPDIGTAILDRLLRISSGGGKRDEIAKGRALERKKADNYLEHHKALIHYLMYPLQR